MELSCSPLFRNIDPQDIPGLLSCMNARPRSFKKGEILRKVPEEQLIDALIDEIKRM